jgi:predicted RNA-binding protein associated with RNAse of E/G family
LAPGSQIRVRVPKHGRPRLEYPAVVQFDDGLHLVLRAGWAEPQTRDLGFVRFEPGDVWTEHYWRERWYSIKEVRDSNGVLKGWYADVVRPVRVEEGLLVAEDLDLDLWLSADRRTILRLDEDEFAASALAESDPAAAAQALRALEELDRLASKGFPLLALKAPQGLI